LYSACYHIWGQGNNEQRVDPIFIHGGIYPILLKDIPIGLFQAGGNARVLCKEKGEKMASSTKKISF
jgi:hypothetical protein